jgi:hypothetical protein
MVVAPPFKAGDPERKWAEGTSKAGGGEAPLKTGK